MHLQFTRRAVFIYQREIRGPASAARGLIVGFAAGCNSRLVGTVLIVAGNKETAAMGPANASRCFLQQIASPFIETPFFVSNSAYDMYQILNELQLGCVPSNASVAGEPPCSPQQMQRFQEYRVAQLAALGPTLANPTTGAWIPSCFVHEMNVDYCSTQSLPNCRGWNLYAVAPFGGAPALSLGAAVTLWYDATMRNYDAILAQRRAFVLALAGQQQPVADEAPKSALAPELARVQVIDQVEYPLNPTCPFPPSPGL